MDNFTVSITTQALKARLGQLSERLDDMTPVMRRIAGELVGGFEEAFDRQTDPNTGTPWERLSDTTIARRKELGHWPGKILQVSGHLASSVVPSYGPDFAAAGTNAVQAAVLNFGASKGAFGTTSRGAPIPWGNIPARPMAGLWEHTEEDILDLMQEYLAAD